jgi:hypothetical protein
LTQGVYVFKTSRLVTLIFRVASNRFKPIKLAILTDDDVVAYRDAGYHGHWS